MASFTHSYLDPDRFVAGTVGQPGDRTFYLQVREGNRLSTVKCEKEQIAILARHLGSILDGLEHNSDLPVPPRLEVATDLGPLDQPLTEDFRVASISFVWDAERACITLTLSSSTGDDDDEDPDDPFDAELNEAIDVRLDMARCREFSARAIALVESGRPACPFCSQPMNRGGHICPRANGLRTPLFAP